MVAGAALQRPYLPVVDTLYGSGASMPMVDGGLYEVWITQSGLIATSQSEAQGGDGGELLVQVSERSSRRAAPPSPLV